ncbi:glycosyltransferase [Edaphobacter sp. HDX4]|uniref:CgeB family protein n=1 Tax=Edaphobacter sp. HDX4 TaxID=2794064 RepID=UPI002FE560BE
MRALGHDAVVFEPRMDWSLENLLQERCGEESLQQFAATYPDLRIELYEAGSISDTDTWREALKDFDVVLVHEWNPPALANTLLDLRETLGYKMLFHDTHHRASSSPEQIRLFGVDRFDGVVVFGEILRKIYRERFSMSRVWTLHEAADTSVFRPFADVSEQQDVVWVGNWGDDERSEEIRRFLLDPAAAMPERSFMIYGVRYPEEAREALRNAGVRYGGYLANLNAPAVYASSRLTAHVPRQQYAREMVGIPTIRVFEALACGVPLISAPWQDAEGLFREGDMLFVETGEEMQRAIKRLLEQPGEAKAQADRGMETVQARHTCRHRAEELTEIIEEVLR